MTTSLIAGNFTTGRILRRALPVRTGACEQILNGAGTISASIRLPAIDPTDGSTLPLVSELVEGKAFLAYVQDGRVLNAGPIWSSQYDSDSQVWSLNAAGARSYLDFRFILPALIDSDLTSLPGSGGVTGMTWANVHLRTIAKRILQNAISANGGSFPVDYEDDVAGTATRTYDALAMKRVNDAFTDLSGVIAGPDIQLVPYITADGQYVRWRLTTADEQRQAGADWVWDTTVPVPNATGVSITRSATSLATTGYELGATTQGTTSDGGTSTSTTLAAKRHTTALIDAGFPRMEALESRQDVIEQATLQGYADDLTAAGKYYTDVLTVKARIDQQPLLADIAVGDYAQIRTKAHPFLGTGSTRVRVLNIGHNRGDATASIACAPIRTAAV